MRVDPDSGELLGPATRIDLVIEIVRHGLVVELHMDPAASLADEPHVLDEQQVVARRNPESTDLRLTQVTQVQELGPGGGAESQYRRTPADRCRFLRTVLLHGI